MNNSELLLDLVLSKTQGNTLFFDRQDNTCPLSLLKTCILRGLEVCSSGSDYYTLGKGISGGAMQNDEYVGSRLSSYNGCGTNPESWYQLSFGEGIGGSFDLMPIKSRGSDLRTDFSTWYII